MSRLAQGVTGRWASLTLSIAAAVLSGISCREDHIAGPAKPGVPQAATTAATALVFSQVSAGSRHTCGVATDHRAYCWGSNSEGQLGDGATFESWVPVPVAGGLAFRQVSTGANHSCGVTVEYLAYCWGGNIYGQLGDGATDDRPTPFPVAGGLRFRRVDSSAYHTCGVTYPDNKAYCWGWNLSGQLGDGTFQNRWVPVPVTGTLRFRQVSAGVHHTCGLTTNNRAFCWGWNRYRQLGDRSNLLRRPNPVRVADGHQFLQLDAGQFHTCGVTTGHQAYCWGDGKNGQIGNGKAYPVWPKQVAGGLSFARVSAGAYHTCGQTTSNRAYCWGSNDYDQLGDGNTRIRRLTPVAVAGELSFSQVSAGFFHTCGKTPAGVAYCWGDNGSGKLGDGTSEQRSVPVAVVGP